MDQLGLSHFQESAVCIYQSDLSPNAIMFIVIYSTYSGYLVKVGKTRRLQINASNKYSIL